MSPRLTFVFICLLLILLANFLIIKGYTNNTAVGNYDNFIHDVLNKPYNPKFNTKIHVDNINLFADTLKRDEVKRFQHMKANGLLPYLNPPKEFHDDKTYTNFKIKHVDHVDECIQEEKKLIEKFANVTPPTTNKLYDPHSEPAKPSASSFIPEVSLPSKSGGMEIPLGAPESRAAGSFLADKSNMEGDKSIEQAGVSSLFVGEPSGAKAQRKVMTQEQQAAAQADNQVKELQAKFARISKQFNDLGVSEDDLVILTGPNPPRTPYEVAEVNRVMTRIQKKGASTDDIMFLRNYLSSASQLQKTQRARGKKEPNPLGYGEGISTSAVTSYSISAFQRPPGSRLPDLQPGWDAERFKKGGAVQQKTYGDLSALLQGQTESVVSKYFGAIVGQNPELATSMNFRRDFPNGIPQAKDLITKPELLQKLMNSIGFRNVQDFNKANPDVAGAYKSGMDRVGTALTGHNGFIGQSMFQ